MGIFFALLGSRGGVVWLVEAGGGGGGFPLVFLVDNPGFFVKERRFRMNTVLTSISIEKSVR